MAVESRVYADDDILPVLRDATIALKSALWADRMRLLRCFVYVPAGLFAMMAVCFGVDRLLNLGGISFPASVTCLVLLFLALLLCERVLGERRTKMVVKLINIPGGWSLRWLNIFFTPAFVMLALSPAISGVEVAKIIAVFVIGFIAMMAFAAYTTRGIQLVLNRPRKALQQTPNQNEGEELTTLVASPSGMSTPAVISSGLSTPASPASPVSPASPSEHLLPGRPPRSHAAAYITVRGQNLDDPLSSFSDVPVPHPRFIIPVRPPRPRVERWAEFVGSHADMLLFTVVLVLVGLPVYYSPAGYAMPLHLCIHILMFFAAMSLPPAWRQILHPVIVSAFSTLLAIYLLGRIHGIQSLTVMLNDYRSNSTYLKIWAAAGTPSARTLPRPGAGDILASIMDVSIISLALPMYQYRHELRRHFFAIIIPNIILSIVSLFVYPVVCYAIGISRERSLAFTARSLTLALATPAVQNLGGDSNTLSAVALISGVLGVLIGQKILLWLRIPEDDYVTRGVTFGANASALGTALLLKTDPRAAALSSLAMSLFGTVTVAFSSIPPMVHIIRSLVGLS